MPLTKDQIISQVAEAKSAYPSFTILVSDDDGTPKVTVSVEHPALADNHIIYFAHLTESGWLRNTSWNRRTCRYECSYRTSRNGWTVLHAKTHDSFAQEFPDEVSATVKDLAALVAKKEYLERKAYA